MEARIQISANPLWLDAPGDDKYLLLQDLDTGDVLMPLLYLKKLFVSNYSRKLSNPKHRLVHLPEDHPLLDEREQDNPLHWVWAFESTSEVKAIVRQELGESAPQGHLRLVLLPIVYNAMAEKDEMRTTGLFTALHAALQQSTYWPLLRPSECRKGLAATRRSASKKKDGGLFAGPPNLEVSAKKYMGSLVDDTVHKRPRPAHDWERRASPASHDTSEDSPAVAQLTEEVKALRMRDQEQRATLAQQQSAMRKMSQDMDIVKTCVAQLYSVLLPHDSQGPGSLPGSSSHIPAHRSHQEHAGRQPHAAGPPSSKQKPLLHKGSSSATQLGSLLQPPVSPRLQHAASATAAHPLKHEADLMALSEDSLMEEGSHGSHLSGMPSDLGTPFSNPHDRLGDLDASFYAAGQTASLVATYLPELTSDITGIGLQAPPARDLETAAPHVSSMLPLQSSLMYPPHGGRSSAQAASGVPRPYRSAAYMGAAQSAMSFATQAFPTECPLLSLPLPDLTGLVHSHGGVGHSSDLCL